jgi:hypothetical protein
MLATGFSHSYFPGIAPITSTINETLMAVLKLASAVLGLASSCRELRGTLKTRGSAALTATEKNGWIFL